MAAIIIKTFSCNLEYEISARKLFDKLVEDGRLSNNVIWWDDLLEVIISGSTQAQMVGAVSTKRIKEKHNVLVCHCKSPIVRVLLVETPHSSCYVVVSKLGNVGIYDQNMGVKVKYTVPLGKYKTAKICWVTDAVYAADANGVIIASTNRNMYFYNSSQIVHKLLFIILAVDNIPLCLHYCGLRNQQAILTIGDEKGDITSMRFFQPHKSFFQPHPDKNPQEPTSYFWIELGKQKSWVEISISRKVHNDEVTSVEYFNENKSVVSSSTDPKRSFVIRHKDGKQSSYVTKLSKGVRRFSLDKRIGLLVTVSGDYTVKLWNPMVTKRPMEELESHVTPVMDVAILKHVRSIISISEDAIVKVWDMETHSCVQTLQLNFPRETESSITSHRNLYPGLGHVANKEEPSMKDVHPTWDNPLDIEDMSLSFKKDIWLRSEIVVVYGRYLKVLELEGLAGLSVAPLPLPRKNLEPAAPTPYYPLCHTFRENTKTLKQKMFKNLASLAPFQEKSTFSSYELHQEFSSQRQEMKTLIMNGAPHLALNICKIKPLSHSFFKLAELE